MIKGKDINRNGSKGHSTSSEEKGIDPQAGKDGEKKAIRFRSSVADKEAVEGTARSCIATIEEEKRLLSNEYFPGYDFGELPSYVQSLGIYKFSIPPLPGSAGSDGLRNRGSSVRARTKASAKPPPGPQRSTGKTSTDETKESPRTQISHQVQQMKPHEYQQRQLQQQQRQNKQATPQLPNTIVPHHPLKQGYSHYNYNASSRPTQNSNSAGHEHPYPPERQQPGQSHYPSQQYQPPNIGACNQQRYWQMPPTILTAAVRPVRRLAKIRPYANQSIPVSAKEIQNAIPKDNSSVFHVMDRRIDFDAFEDKIDGGSANNYFHVNVPIYSMLRAWVQDDPYRQVLPPQPLLPNTEFVLELHSQGLDTMAKGRPDKSTSIVDGKCTDKKRKATKATLDMTSFLKKTRADVKSSTTEFDCPSLESLKNDMVQQAKGIRKRKNKKHREKIAAVLHGLQHRGVLGLRYSYS